MLWFLVVLRGSDQFAIPLAIAGSLMLGAPVSTRPAKRRTRFGAVSVKSYQLPVPDSGQFCSADLPAGTVSDHGQQVNTPAYALALSETCTSAVPRLLTVAYTAPFATS